MKRSRRLRIGRCAALVAAVPIAVLLLADLGTAAPSGATDLRVTKTASAAKARVGATLGYTIRVENLGPLTASGVTVTDSLPSGVQFSSVGSTLGSCTHSAGKVTCGVGLLGAGSRATITLNVILRQAGTVTNTASVKGDQKDPSHANDKASATTQALAGNALSCRGVQATIVGTPGNDRIVGTSGRDVVVTLGGDDSVIARGGRDLICTGKGNDYVSAGAAADRVFAGAGRDRVLGRGGPDVLRGNGGNDVLKGNGGQDRLLGGRGTDRCYGGAGRDSVRCELPRRRT